MMGVKLFLGGGSLYCGIPPTLRGGLEHTPDSELGVHSVHYLEPRLQMADMQMRHRRRASE